MDSFFERIKLFAILFLRNNAQMKQIFKFLGIGLLNTLVGYGVFFFLVNYTNYLLALLIAHIIGVIHSYIWNKYWIFKIKEFDFLEFIRFNVIYAVVFIVNATALFICVDLIQVNPKLAQLLLLPVITAVSFFGQKLWTFKKIDSEGEL